jgi:succinate dehydrogenase cytochrome b556 subunit
MTRSLCSSPKGVFLKDGLEYSQRMDKTGRPISPHIGIYAFPTIAMSSITVRITGGMASFGFFGVGALALAGSSDSALSTVSAVADYAPTLAKFSVAYVLSYQWFGSARHLYWDMTAKGFHNHMMYQSSMVMFAITAGVSAGIALYSLPPPPSKPKS